MLTKHSTVKSRLGIAAADVTNDPLLTRSIETITAFELKSAQTGWTVQTSADYIIRRNRVISLAVP